MENILINTDTLTVAGAFATMAEAEDAAVNMKGSPGYDIIADEEDFASERWSMEDYRGLYNRYSDNKVIAFPNRADAVKKTWAALVDSCEKAGYTVTQAITQQAQSEQDEDSESAAPAKAPAKKKAAKKTAKKSATKKVKSKKTPEVEEGQQPETVTQTEDKPMTKKANTKKTTAKKPTKEQVKKKAASKKAVSKGATKKTTAKAPGASGLRDTVVKQFKTWTTKEAAAAEMGGYSINTINTQMHHAKKIDKVNFERRRNDAGEYEYRVAK